ncbi:TPA: NAD-dependent epimerase/dehydratase family protein [Citrobacter amalonaticus]|uniref:NAD-dependent epimerase/dehydratase family protein n=1 Tax=Citrobacter amalonaticus TaxID=35703 RepID=A0A9C7QKH6_CITAM|nr:NAD-dependent epimerase/dehydratase family protein [Citrobacter amalonaticus]
MSTTVAVTGGTGFIGRHIIDDLLSRGFTVRALTRTPHHDERDNLVWVLGSLEESESLAQLVAGVDHVVHCAGQVRGHKEEVFTRCNVEGSQRLMQAAKESGSCQRFLFISSLAARHPELSWYANSKYVAEQRLTEIAGGITLGIFRPTAMYGPGDKELSPLFRAMLHGYLPRFGAADTRLSFLHVSDLAQAVSQWLLADQTPVSPYELCDGVADGYNWQRLQDIAVAIRNRPVRVVSISRPLLNLMADTSSLISRLSGKEPMLTRSKVCELTHSDWSANNKDLYEIINWSPRISLEYALRQGLF